MHPLIHGIHNTMNKSALRHRRNTPWPQAPCTQHSPAAATLSSHPVSPPYNTQETQPWRRRYPCAVWVSSIGVFGRCRRQAKLSPQELAPLTELAKVALPDVILCGHVDLIVGADEDECCEIRRVHVRVGESQKATVGGFGLHRAQGSRP